MLHRCITTLAVCLLLGGCTTENPAPVGPRPDPASLGGWVRLGGDSARILRGGEPTAKVILGLINGASRRVDVEMYEFGRDDIAAAIISAHDRSVAVTVIDDPSVDVTVATTARLRAAGVDVIDYPVRSLMIDHVKLLIVDDQVAVVGGINWGSSSFANHDFDAELTGPSVTNLARIYARDLITCGRDGVVPLPVPDSDIIVASTLPAADIRPLALDVIERARQRLDLALFVLTDRGVVHAVLRAARRGVLVRVLLDPGQRPSDASERELLAGGVPVLRYRGHGEKLHAKAAVADGATVVFGSANWSAGGFIRNHEIDLEIPNAPALAGEFEVRIDADWAVSR
jgi:phosphatidylserine/phosphatidylglycerophosphate/cardiolipin synthase-like enzyme